MSKIQQAKEAQGYSTVAHGCANCKHFSSKKEVVQPRKSYLAPYEKETNLRCGLGGFAVKKTATCNRIEKKQSAG